LEQRRKDLQQNKNQKGNYCFAAIEIFYEFGIIEMEINLEDIDSDE
jgi:hypothetical protein